MTGWCVYPPTERCLVGWYRAIATIAMFASVVLLFILFVFLFFYAIVS